VDFSEFVCALATFYKGTADEKLTLMFNAYDTNSDGYLDNQEVYLLCKAVLQFAGQDLSNLKENVDKLFSISKKITSEQKLSLEDFKKLVMSNEFEFLSFILQRQK